MTPSQARPCARQICLSSGENIFRSMQKCYLQRILQQQRRILPLPAHFTVHHMLCELNFGYNISPGFTKRYSRKADCECVEWRDFLRSPCGSICFNAAILFYDVDVIESTSTGATLRERSAGKPREASLRWNNDLASWRWLALPSDVAARVSRRSLSLWRHSGRSDCSAGQCVSSSCSPDP